MIKKRCEKCLYISEMQELRAGTNLSLLAGCWETRDEIIPIALTNSQAAEWGERPPPPREKDHPESNQGVKPQRASHGGVGEALCGGARHLALVLWGLPTIVRLGTVTCL